MKDLADDLAFIVRNSIAYIKELEAELARCKQVCAATAEAWREEAALTEPVQEPVQEPDVPEASCGNMEPAGWFEGPFGEFRANQLFKHSWPAQTVAWSIPLYLAPPQRLPLTEEERNFCPRCGKRTNDIHTCTPPHEERFCDTHCTWADHAPGCVRAEPVQEPVAWRWRMRNLTDAPGFVQPWTVTTYYPREQANEIEPLYTTPPQRKPLPVDQIYEMYNEPCSDAEMVEFARAIERAHGIT
jgi:hypothetical protein